MTQHLQTLHHKKVAEKGKRDSECNEVWFRSIRVIISVSGIELGFYISLEFFGLMDSRDFVMIVLQLVLV